MIFLTVGTQFPFDRMIKTVDRLAECKQFDEEIYAQIGESRYKPVNFKSISNLNSKEYERYICEASSIISHSGIGTIEMAMKYQKPLLVLPRMKKYKEVVNDHQVAIAEILESEGYLLAAFHEDEIEPKAKQLKKFIPKKRGNSSESVVERICKYLETIESGIF